MINKKAQGFSTTELLVTVAVIATVVIVIIGVFGGFDTLFSKIGLAPDNAESYAVLCPNYVTLPNTYCNYGGDFKEVKLYSETQRVNCEYLSTKFVFNKMNDVCNAQQVAIAANQTCVTKKLKPTYKINGIPCSDYLKGTGAAANTITTITDGTGSCTAALGTQTDISGIIYTGTKCPDGFSVATPMTVLPSGSVCCVTS